ncbi:DUF2194 domain-containing protein [Paenibacillus sinopodophylli]|uniref:DUF2194 domain-containing protein n=1 Tax=Paenibacillus sinopodophylli TaxID=1837342 RepID=UPI00110CDB4A|nr:DUF2194 domain-containing protein [Paenibacillus sinopodophylli]
MKKELNFSKNIYIILLVILSLGVLIQIARSQYVLQFKHNKDLLEQREALLANVKENPPKEISGTNYCVVYKGSDDYSMRLKNNASRTLQYMQKHTTEINIDEQAPRFSDCGVLIVAYNSLEQLGDINQIDQYVNKGGHILFMSSLNIDPEFQVIYRKMGIAAFGELHELQGIALMSNVLIGEKELRVDEEFMSNSTMSVELDHKSQVLATTTDGTPLLWKRAYGKGTFMVFNGSMFQEKINRGFFAGALSLLEPQFIYPIFNSKIFFIDDFPAPISKGVVPAIYREYKRDTPSFYQQIWWPDMLKAAKKYAVKYTAVIIQSYHDEVLPPFENPIDEDRFGLISYGREVIKSGGEIGIHGYNHQSLVVNKAVSDSFGYNAWKNADVMAESIKEVLSFTSDAFPKYSLLSYVPPSNVLDEEGRKALKKGWPNLTVISSLYGEDASGMAYVQEYEIAKDGIIEMPRVTSGYMEDSFEHWAEANAMTGLGVYSHFVHPDDVLSSARSKNQTWEKLYEGFTDKLKRLKKTYPWVRPMTSTEAALDMGVALTSQLTVTETDNRIEGEISNYRSNLYYVLRSDKKIGKQVNCSVQKIDANTFLVEVYNSKFTIELGG